MRRALVAAGLMALLAGPALTQPAARPPPPPDDDIIGSLLDPNHHPTKEEEDEPDTAARNAGGDVETTAAPPGRLRYVPFAPPPQTERGRAVAIEEAGRTPDRPPAPRDAAYDARIRQSFAAAESYQGPLDGGWTLAEDRSGGDRFRFQIVERRDRLEAAWRDLRAKDALTTSGLVDQIQRSGSNLTLNFLDGRGAAVRLSLQAAGDDRWRGELAQGDQHQAVTLRRTSP